MSLGIPENKIIAKSSPKDTQEEAKLITPILTNKTFALVTNASHMPRAEKYFVLEGVQPIHAPTGYLMKAESTTFLENLPKASTLNQTTKVWHEVLGKIAQWFNS